LCGVPVLSYNNTHDMAGLAWSWDSLLQAYSFT
jgi:hypothetical protein